MSGAVLMKSRKKEDLPPDLPPPLSVGMQTTAEIRLGNRTVAEYLLSPVQKAWHEAGRAR